MWEILYITDLYSSNRSMSWKITDWEEEMLERHDSLMQHVALDAKNKLQRTFIGTIGEIWMCT